MTAREEIATAASTVDGVSVTPYYRTPLPMKGYVRLALSSPDSAFPKEMVDTWEVVIPIGQDPVQAEKKIDDIRGALLDALRPVLYITGLEPVTLTYDGAQITALSITGTKEG